MIRILHLEDNSLDARLVAEYLLDAQLEFDIQVVSDSSEFVAAIDSQAFDLVLADYYLPGFDGIAAMRMLQEREILTPVILVSGKIGEEAAIEGLKSGAVDYILKDSLRRLGPAVYRALEEHQKYMHALQVEREIRKQAQVQRQAEQIGGLGSFEWNLSTQASYWSAGLNRIHGIDEGDDSPGFPDYFERFVHQEDRERLMLFFQQSVKQGGTLDMEYRIHRTDGPLRYLRCQASFAQHRSETIMAGVIQDITEQKLAIESLTRSEEKYRNLVEQATDGIMLSDEQLRFVEVNRSAIDMLDAEAPRDLLGKDPRLILDRDELAERPLDMERLMSGQPVTNVRKVHTLKGRQKFLELTSKRLPGGKIQTAFRDVTDRVEAINALEELNRHLDDRVQEATAMLREQEEKYRLISENASDLIAQTDAAGTFLYLSPSFQELLGYDPERWLGKTMEPLVIEADREAWRETFFKHLEQPQDVFTHSYRVQDAQGQVIWVETKYRMLRNQAGEVLTLHTATRDINERKRAEEDIARAFKRERELIELRAQFVSMASHQFRTPLTVINSNMQLMEILGIDKREPKVADVIRRVQNETARLTSLMNDVLVLGKLNAHKIRPKFEVTDLKEFLEELTEQHFGPQPDGRQLQLELPETMPKVVFDPGLISHVLINLIGNAFKYSEGQAAPRLRLHVYPEAWELGLIDQGIGVPVAEQERLFEPFYRAGNTEGITGTGLGLVIAREFTELHRGDIWFQPGKPRGSEFWIKIPRDLSPFEGSQKAAKSSVR